MANNSKAYMVPGVVVLLLLIFWQSEVLIAYFFHRDPWIVSLVVISMIASAIVVIAYFRSR